MCFMCVAAKGNHADSLCPCKEGGCWDGVTAPRRVSDGCTDVARLGQSFCLVVVCTCRYIRKQGQPRGVSPKPMALGICV